MKKIYNIIVGILLILLSIDCIGATDQTRNTVNVSAEQAWTDTRVDITFGTKVNIVADGLIDVGRRNKVQITPDGGPDCIDYDDSDVAPGLPCWSLVGKIEDGVPFFVGTEKNFVANSTGRLYLGVNDGYESFGDNSGEWIAIITTDASPFISITKSASPYSIRQSQETTVKILIDNKGAADAKDIEVIDSIHPNFDLSGGNFPDPKKYDIIRAGESRDMEYIIKPKESGTFNLDPATITYADSEGNIKEVKSGIASVKVIPSSDRTTESNSPSESGSDSAVLLHGEKTDVVLGEDILLRLSAVNIINRPPMTVQVILYPPSGMSITGSQFVESGAGIYTTTYILEPGKGRDIEVHITSNQIGDFNVKGRIVYYFGDDKKSTDRTLTLPIKVRKEQDAQAPVSTSAKSPGFEIIIGMIILLIARLSNRYL